MSLPFVSCLCPTYARLPAYGHLLGEAVESWRRQDYPLDRRELLILNDCAAQVLVCEAPGVRVVNLSDRLPTLGEKYNRMVELSLGEVLLPWEDDDLSLPGRITQAVAALAGGYGYFNPQRSWFWNGGRLHSDHSHGVCHNASAFTRESWARAGGYPALSGAQDAWMDGALKRAVRVAPPLAGEPAAWQYVYRWGCSPCHLSGFSDHEAAYRAGGHQLVVPGEFVVVPGYLNDYERQVADHLASLRA